GIRRNRYRIGVAEAHRSDAVRVERHAHATGAGFEFVRFRVAVPLPRKIGQLFAENRGVPFADVHLVGRAGARDRESVERHDRDVTKSVHGASLLLHDESPGPEDSVPRPRSSLGLVVGGEPQTRKTRGSYTLPW